MSASVSGWKGKIVGLITNGEGKAVLEVQLPCDDEIDVSVKTWNNAMSDIMDHTLIPQSSKMFDTLADLGKGKVITISGAFISGDEKNGWRESSLSEEGSMTDPEFIFRFAQVSADPCAVDRWVFGRGCRFPQMRSDDRARPPPPGVMTHPCSRRPRPSRLRLLLAR